MLPFSFHSSLLLLLVLASTVSCMAWPGPDLETSHRIGVVHPITGGGVAHSVPVLLGIQRAVSDVNRRWSLEGRHLEVVVEDGECTRRGGLAAARRLTEMHGVQLVYGGGCSHETLGMGDYLAEQGVVLLTPLTSSGTGDFSYRNAVSKSAQARSLLPVLQARGFRRFALLSNDTSLAQGFRQAYVELLPTIGGHIFADEVVPAGARIDTTGKSLTTYGALAGGRSQVSRQLELIYTPDVLWPADAGDVRAQADRIAASAPDAVIVLPHRAADGWFMLQLVRDAGFDGSGSLNHVIDSDDKIIHHRRYRELIEGFYVPSLPPQPDPDWPVLEGDGYCDSDRHCSAAYAGVLLMAEALRACEAGEPGCLSDFVTQNPDWGSRTFGVLDVAEEAGRGGDFQVYQVRDARFIPVDGEQPVAESSP